MNVVCVTDKINICYLAKPEIQAAIEANLDYIKNEVLAQEIVAGVVEKGSLLEEGHSLFNLSL
jgi:hypothetical protein